MKLTDGKINNIYIVESIDQQDKEALNKISSMGLLPGTELILIQKKPILIFKVYNSRFAIDNYLGEKIYVKSL
ncbi:MAG: ferrous iron transport protein A [Calditerrivibrio sp.]|nr:ferrous iron transport protein A [Calditerrivibrio sp.]